MGEGHYKGECLCSDRLLLNREESYKEEQYGITGFFVCFVIGERMSGSEP